MSKMYRFAFGVNLLYLIAGFVFMCFALWGSAERGAEYTFLVFCYLLLSGLLVGGLALAEHHLLLIVCALGGLAGVCFFDGLYHPAFFVLCVLSMLALWWRLVWLLALATALMSALFFISYVFYHFSPAFLMAFSLCANIMVLLGSLPFVGTLHVGKARALFILNGMNGAVQLASLIGLVGFYYFPRLPQEIMFLGMKNFDSLWIPCIEIGVALLLTCGCCCAVYRRKKRRFYCLAVLLVLLCAGPRILLTSQIIAASIGEMVVEAYEYSPVQTLLDLLYVIRTMWLPQLPIFIEKLFVDTVLVVTALLNLYWGRYLPEKAGSVALLEGGGEGL